jgi:hypothetical protein
LERIRLDELTLLKSLGEPANRDLAATAALVWRWLSDPDHRGVLILWTESYARALADPHGAWADFAARTVHDWLAVLAGVQPAALRRTQRGAIQRTLLLSVLRGAMLDLLATAELARTSAVHAYLKGIL